MAKQRYSWTEQALKKAVDAVRRNLLSQRVASNTYHVPRRTIRNHLQEESPKKVKCGAHSVFSKEDERDMATRIIRFNEIGFPITGACLRRFAFSFAEKKALRHPFNTIKQQAGRDWLKGFLKRHPQISKRRAQHMNPARGQKLNKFIVNDHFDHYEKVLSETHLYSYPDRIWNMDEKGVQLNLHHQPTVLAEKGVKRVKVIAPEHGSHVTVVGCGNAAGTVIPPMVIYKGTRNINTLVSDPRLPPRSLVVFAKKGNMTQVLFIKWLKHLAEFTPNTKKLVVFDGAKCHLSPDICDEADKLLTELYCLPSNTSHELQPMDKANFGPFEVYWDQEVNKFWGLNPDRSITRSDFSQVFTPVWNKAMTPANVISGFRATGLYPCNRNVIPESAFAPSTITHQEEQKSDSESSSSTSSDSEEEDDGDDDRVGMNTGDPHQQRSSSPKITSEDSSDDDDHPLVSPVRKRVTQPVSERDIQSLMEIDDDSGSSKYSPSGSSDTTSSDEEISFRDFLPTPKRKKKTTALRAKALNYRGVHVKKSLFPEPVLKKPPAKKKQAATKKTPSVPAGGKKASARTAVKSKTTATSKTTSAKTSVRTAAKNKILAPSVGKSKTATGKASVQTAVAKGKATSSSVAKCKPSAPPARQKQIPDSSMTASAAEAKTAAPYDQVTAKK